MNLYILVFFLTALPALSGTTIIIVSIRSFRSCSNGIEFKSTDYWIYLLLLSHDCSVLSWFSAAKVVAATVLTVGGGVGGTIIYAKWDHKFRAAVEKNVPYSDWLFNLALGPSSQDGGIPIRKQVRMIFVCVCIFCFFLTIDVFEQILHILGEIRSTSTVGKSSSFQKIK